MNIYGLLFLLIAHYLIGCGLLKLFRVQLHPVSFSAVAFITGIVILSFIPFILQLFYLPITFSSVLITICVVTFLFSIPLWRSFNQQSFFSFGRKLIPSFKIYEIPYLIIFFFILADSAWLCFYFPPNARDMLTGPETVAEFTVKEHTMLNSAVQLCAETSNNHLKPPFITGLQVIYKLFVAPFGKTWMTLMFFSFVFFLYRLLNERLHPVISGFLLLLFIAMKEPFAYTMIMLFDYANMVVFFLASWFFVRHLEAGDTRLFYFSALLFGLATFIRSETVVFSCMLLLLLWFVYIRKKHGFKTIITRSLLFFIIPFFFYFIWINIFLRFYMPGQFELSGQLNETLPELSSFFIRLRDMTTELVFSDVAVRLWGYFIFTFLGLLVAEIIFGWPIQKQSLYYIYIIIALFTGFAALGCIIPLFDLMTTTKRAFLKMFPLMLIVMRNNTLLLRLTERIKNWENKKEVLISVQKSSTKRVKK